VSTSHSGVRCRRNWLGSSVFWLDDWLRKWQHVYEYSDHPACLFRIQRADAEVDVKLAEGVSVRRGDPILNLHLWNEHLPALDPGRPDFPWARLIGREIATSLERLAAHMAQDSSYDDIVALRAEMRFGAAEQNMRIVRLSARYGFESVTTPDGEKVGAVRELGENALVLMLILAANPGAARFSALKHDSALIYMSRVTLDRYYLPRSTDGCGGAPQRGSAVARCRLRFEMDRSEDGRSGAGNH
jgi:hypothetical protein